ncbi:MAG TPA: S8 family serine peptidase [Acidimicrobiales bacterium]
MAGRKIRWGLSRRVGAIAALTTASLVATAPPASAGLLGSLLGTVTGTVTGVVDSTLGILTPGWDDNATTPPVHLSTVADAVGTNDLWPRGFTGKTIGVAVVDSGVAPVGVLGEPGKVVNGPDLSFEGQTAAYAHADTFGHGTHMAGIVAGVAPGAHVVNMKVATREGAADVSQVIAAIDWVVAHRNDPGMNIRVLSLSYGTDSVQPYQVDPLAHAVESAWRNGIVVVVSGGNDGTTRGTLTNPATDPHVIAVGAADIKNTPSASDDVVAPFSSRGSASRTVDVVAPGVSIASLRTPGSTIDDAHPTARVDDRYFRGSGSSQAAAVTAGGVAVLLQARPSLTPDKVKALVRATATPLANTDARSQGRGRLNVAAAAQASVPYASTQLWTRSSGTGSLEASRGTSHVAADDIELRGEQDIMGSPWVPATWAPLATAGAAWTGGTWNGVEWTGSCWCGTSWASSTWSGKSWTGKSWTGKSWTGDEWAGKSWTGKSWTGDGWTGKSWTGKSWTGKSWTSG